MESLELLMKNVYDKMKKHDDKLQFRNKQTRKTERIYSNCCEFQLSFDDGNEFLDDNHHNLVRFCNNHGDDRNLLFGIYGSSAAEKSHFIDNFCNKYIEKKKEMDNIELIPISLRRMDIKVDGKMDGDEKIFYYRLLCLRMLYVYFFHHDNEEKSRHRRYSRMRNFATCYDLLRHATASMFPSLLIKYIDDEIVSNGKSMVLIIDDLTDFQAKQKDFLDYIATLKYPICFSTTLVNNKLLFKTVNRINLL